MMHHPLPETTQELIWAENQLERWLLVGPMMTLATLLPLLVTPERSLALAIIAIIGLPLSWKWGLQGATAASVLAFITFGLQIGYVSWLNPYWMLGLTIAMIISFYITALCSHEVERLLDDAAPGDPIDDSKLRLLEDELAALQMRYAEETKSTTAELADSKLALVDLKRALADAKSAYDVLKQELDPQKQALENYKLQLDAKTHELKLNTELLESTKAKLAEADNREEGVLQELFQRRHEYTLLKQQFEGLQEKLSLREQELTQCHQKADELLAICSEKEALLAEQLKAAQKQIQEQPQSDNKTHPSAKTPSEKEAFPKERTPKKTKTTSWANAIMSRCDQPKA